MSPLRPSHQLRPAGNRPAAASCQVPIARRAGIQLIIGS
jgi:hypothetical protein